jgi:hypothetical protein
LFGLPSQLANPAAHVGVQAPAEQSVVPLAFAHAVPQVPQFVVVLSGASQPLVATPSQLPKPAEHVKEQVPPVHDDVAFAALQALPHAPQFCTLLELFVSQPLPGIPSQSRKLPLQTGVQAPPAQLVVPLAFVHTVPQPPQFDEFVLVLVSHPFVALPSQLPKPALHAGTHAPPLQLVVPLAFVQTWPQPPQFDELVLMLASQPFEALPSQFAKPALHVGAQAPAVQVVVPLAFVQELPQEPQSARVVLRFTSQPVDASPSQLPNPELQAIEHEPRAQLGVPFVELQAAPHDPQLPALVSVLVSQPFVALASQLPNPVLHVPSVHVPETHDAFAFARLHTAPQAPQLVRLVFVFVSQPLPGRPSQSPRPALQTLMPQTPLTQFAVPPVLGQTLPHVLQLLTSEVTFASQPLFGLPSQSLKPALHVGTHAPAVQVVDPCAFTHAMPQPPQFVVVFVGVSQPFFVFPSQSPKFAEHVGAQEPPLHATVPFALVHAMPQPPQFAADVCVFVSQPLFGLPSQLPNPALQLGVQVPAGQLVVPFALVHAVPQAPQFAVVFSEASHPSVTSLLQLPKLPLQVMEHAPRAQLAVPFVLEHAEPQAPQFVALVCVFTSQPFAGLPSQLPKPELHVPSVQAPEAQDSDALAKSQRAPQEPQFVSCVRLVSQPFPALPSQFPNPAVHEPS